MIIWFTGTPRPWQYKPRQNVENVEGKGNRYVLINSCQYRLFSSLLRLPVKSNKDENNLTSSHNFSSATLKKQYIALSYIIKRSSAEKNSDLHQDLILICFFYIHTHKDWKDTISTYRIKQLWNILDMWYKLQELSWKLQDNIFQK